MSLNNRRRIFRTSFPAARRLSGSGALRALAWTLAILGSAGGGITAWNWVASDATVARAVDALLRGSSPAEAERLVANAERVAVVDGNTLRLADRVVRLAGVVPPARGETCQARDGSAFDCGIAATNALAAMLRHGTVDCTTVGTDRHGRPRAACSTGGASLNQAVVAQGWARASDDTLLAAEQSARARQLGLWAMAR